MSLEKVVKTRLILLEDFLVLLLGLGGPGLDVLRRRSPPDSLTVPSAFGSINVSPLLGR